MKGKLSLIFKSIVIKSFVVLMIIGMTDSAAFRKHESGLRVVVRLLQSRVL